MSARFGSREPDKFAGIDWAPSKLGSPVIEGSLAHIDCTVHSVHDGGDHFVVFGAAIGSRMGEIDGVSYGAFIIPGLIMLSLLNESISNASFGIYMPRFVGTIYELLSAPLSFLEIVIGFVGAAATSRSSSARSSI